MLNGRMVSIMNIKHRIFTALLMLLVFTGQAMATESVSICDMDHLEMSHHQMDMSDMDHDMMGMASDATDCCDDDMSSCAMDCSFSMVSILSSFSSIQVEPLASFKIILASSVTIARPALSLFRPPISA